MPLQRLDPRTIRFDELSGSVLIDGRNCVVEISLDAVEQIARRKFSPDQAVAAVGGELLRLARLASKLPPDDGKIHITANLVRSDGRFDED